ACLGQWDSCDPKASKCCPNYACEWKYPWCRYKLF
uniref:Mu-theraphotoxin-Pspp1 n=1 Tax=Phlogiellus sp. TaxID=2211175 RepID=TXP1_PHLXX|nr:RecName: Full=Mu-theraphotoxin-Pspp1; Short=Mu-TRTX-Pspp1; AltName: Full=Phlotoxin 1; Short=PhlTx1 [Phlogiellus sp. PE-2016]